MSISPGTKLLGRYEVRSKLGATAKNLPLRSHRDSSCFMLPVICYPYILFYALKGRR